MIQHALFYLMLTIIFNTQTIIGQSSSAPRSYVAYKTLEPMLIDGKAEEEAWANAPESENFIDIEGEITPKYQTTMKMLWDEDYLYFYAKMQEPHIWATLKQRDTVIFYNNDFEIFIDPTGDTHNYFEFEMNALNTVWDLFIAKPYRESAPVLNNWDIEGLKSNVFIKGTINDPTDTDEFWSIEVAIPWDVLKEANVHNDIPIGEFWRINFSRVNWPFDLENESYSRAKDSNGKFKPEYNWVWSPQGVINMHEPEHWGYVYFSDRQPTKNEEFVIPKDQHIKWELYRLYRAQKTHKEKYGVWAKTLSAITKNNFIIEGLDIQFFLEVHQSGWNIWAQSPFTEQLLLIKEDGEFLELETE